MTKQIINVGTSANDRRGDSLRAAFQKVNANFTELYTTLGLDTAPLNLGAFEFTGSVLSTTDSSSITIDQATTVTSNLTVGGDLLPSVANGGDLGSAARPWKSLYVSNNTIYIGNTAVGINQLGQLTVAGSQVNSIDRLNSSGDEVVLVGGANPYVTFPAITGGDQLIIQGAEVSSVSGSLAITSQDNLNIIANGSGAAPGGSKNWTFGFDGSITFPVGNSYLKENAYDFSINTLSYDDETTLSWTFDRSGHFNVPLSIEFFNSAVGVNAIGTMYGQSEGMVIAGYTGRNLQIAANDGTGIWTFGTDGSLTLPGNLQSNGNINVEINLADSTKRIWQFGEDGDLNIPGAVRQGDAKLAFNETGGINVYLTPTTDDSTAVFITTTSVQAYATQSASLTAGTQANLQTLQETWMNAEVVWIDERDIDASMIAPATRPWAGMSSYDAYPVIIAYTAPGGVLPTPSNFLPVANSAKNAHAAWQEALAPIDGVSITAGAKTWQFTATGVLELPGAVQLKVYDNTLERDLYIETPVAGMMVLVGTATQIYDGSVWRTLSYV